MARPKKVKDLNPEDVVKDIKSLLRNVSEGKGIPIDPTKLAILGANVAVKIQNGLKSREGRTRPPKTLFMSEIGSNCLRKLWYQVNEAAHGPFDKEPLEYSTLIKFMYGDILEELVLFLAEQSGHKVEDKQKLVEVNLPRGWKLRGKMDAKIDGMIVDVKSASSYSFQKFQKGLKKEEDDFGYLRQLQQYNEADPGLSGKTAFLAINKETGGLTLDVHDTSKKGSITAQEALVEALEESTPPERGYEPKPTTGGNEKLCTSCSYCAYKYECWQDANDGKGLRMFMYANKPEFLTKVKSLPRVAEVVRFHAKKAKP